ncbi:MAG: bifunctional 4-hydroxy-2-oxoglutarate aldolase/2-dehydro-3-deoxy-phosphogluconate aldolase, partial [Treponema sp.]|nr:bifunctional 4-hydroxy-2-oxoglutarate aldolase/2-dehydro-3-deoxy-phosphogluconate aldolase [Treponema sp.]
MNEFNAKIAEIGIVPVIKLNNPERDAAPLAKALCEGGVPVAEVTFRAEGADKAIAIMRKERPEMLVGAGTVTRTEQIDRVKEAGGLFVVTPGFDPELVAYAQKVGLPIFPGCTSATDYHAALKFGLELIKFFPAEQEGGLAKIKALSAPFPMFKIMPT